MPGSLPAVRTSLLGPLTGQQQTDSLHNYPEQERRVPCKAEFKQRIFLAEKKIEWEQTEEPIFPEPSRTYDVSG